MVQQTQRDRWERIKEELTTLTFITRGGNWLFLLLSRFAEPLMFLSVFYVIAETVLPTLFLSRVCLQLSNSAIIVLNIAPEVILPGCFVQAAQAEQNERWKFKAMGGVFLGLTFLTLASFIWQFPPQVNSIILFFRCAAGVLYSLLIRMTPIAVDEPGVVDRLRELIGQFNGQLEAVQTNLQHHVQTQVHTMVQTSVQTAVQGTVQSLLNGHLTYNEQVQATLATLPDVIYQQISRSLAEQIQAVVAQEMQKFMETSTGTLTDQTQSLTMLTRLVEACVVRSETVLASQQGVYRDERPSSLPRAAEGSGGKKTRPLHLLQATTPPVKKRPSHSTTRNAKNEPVQTRIHRYIREQLEGKKTTPTIAEIMNHCKVSKGTAIRYRRSFTSTEGEGVA